MRTTEFYDKSTGLAKFLVLLDVDRSGSTETSERLKLNPGRYVFSECKEGIDIAILFCMFQIFS